MSKKFKYNTRIYYEDTDAGGVVYYANYLKFLERARSEAIYSLGLSNKEILNKENVIIIVKSCNIEYKKPAKFEDKIEIISKITEVKNSSFNMNQVIKKKLDIISEADVVLVTVNKKGKPVRIPNILKKLID
tara:strand:- start:425 stop:820 length:396 start_codon:yes stop_codon:yes gene_type:complete